MRSFLSLLCVTTLFVASCQKDVIPPDNVVPKVDAGPAQVITVNTATLKGSASDTDGRVVAYLWSQVSGPSKAIIVNEGAATTSVRDLKNGTYLFQLMATDDKGATGVDTVSVQAKLPVSQTLTLQPATNPGEFQFVYYLSSYMTNTAKEVGIESWTKNGDQFDVRALLKFDLSSIPATATITSARLYLYSFPSAPYSGNQIDANAGSANSFYVRQITANWNAGSISWSNPPTVTSANQVFVPHTNDKQLDLNLDVKGQIASMVANNANYGFYLKLENEVTYNARIFVGSNESRFPDKYPKLVVTYE
jgi:hypothetical protein